MTNELDVVQSQEKGLIEVSGVEAIDKAVKISAKLVPIIEKQNLYTIIQKNKHVHVTGWTTLGAMLGVFPIVGEPERIDKGAKVEGYLVEMEKQNWKTKQVEKFEKFVKKALYNKKTMKIIPDPDGVDIREVEEIKYKTKVELKTIGGHSVGQGYAICSNLEEGKLDKPEYVIASMSQTRATGKAFRLSFAWIMTLSGYADTPMEDMEQTTIGGAEDEPERETEKIKSPVVKHIKPEPKQEDKKEPEKILEPIETDKNETPIPTDPQQLRDLYMAILTQAKGLKIDVQKIYMKLGIKKLTIDDVPKLIPILRAEIENKIIEDSERG